MFKIFVFVVLISNWYSAYSITKGNSKLFDSLTSGIKLTGNILKMDHVNGVTKLVSDAYTNLTNTNSGPVSTANQIFTGFIKLLGFDAKKIGAIAINSLIFLAHLLGTSLMHKPFSTIPGYQDEQDINSENPFDWIVDNKEIMKMISHVADRNLPEHVIEYVKERSLDEESGCIQLLICQISPFIWEMQKALNSTNSSTGNDKTILFRYLPTRNEIRQQCESCEERYQLCT